jgi:uncharacterized protein
MPPVSPELEEKAAALESRLREAGRVVVAFSGGADSSYLAFAAHRALGEDSLAVTALSPSYPAIHRKMADRVVEQIGIRHRYVNTAEMEREGYRANRSDRCYFCKTELFEVLGRLREEVGFDCVAYGLNADDRHDFRPGHRAAEEHRVLAPLLEEGFSKAEIRELSRAAGLPTADLPASACLASRLPYGMEVTSERLRQVEEGEQRLRDLGFRQVRLRHHAELARVEIDPSELPEALDPAMAKAIVAAIKPLGFRFVSLDLEGYRTGALNEVLWSDRKQGE